MKKIDVTEAYGAIIDVLKMYRDHIRLFGTKPIEVTIPNVAFVDFIKLYALIHPKKKLYMPCEYTHQKMVIEHKPADGCTILIVSEPCIKYKVNINLINYN
jgi:hypothetical protein